MGGWENGGAKENTLKDLGGKLDNLNTSVKNLDASTAKANTIMIVLTIAIFILTFVLVVTEVMALVKNH